jgi:hypothetical protein
LTSQPWEEYVKTYLERLEVVRFHITTTYVTLLDYRDDVRLIYKCGKSPPSALPLFWQDRQIQTNMIVMDSKNQNLVYLPHDDCYALEREYIRKLWAFYVAEATEKGRLIPPNPPEALLKVGEFDLPGPLEQAALDWLKQEISTHPDYKALPELYRYIALMCRWYIPLVETPPSGQTEYLFVRAGLDYYQFSEAGLRPGRPTRPGGQVGRPTASDWLEFALAGTLRLKHPVPFDVIYYPPWVATRSVHLRLRLPLGLIVRGRPETDFDSVLKDSYFLRALRASPSEVYAYLGLFESRAILVAIRAELERRERLQATLTDSMGFRYVPYQPKPLDGTTTTTAGSNQHPVPVPVAKEPLPELNILTRVSLSSAMIVLIGLFWAVVATDWIYRLYGPFTISGFFALLSALLIVVVATAIATIDKPTVRIPVSVHTVLAVTVFFACLLV